MFNLSKWNKNQSYPLNDIDKLHQEIDQLFDFAFPRLSLAQPSLIRGDWSPAIDISETDDSIFVKADLPGLKKENVQVSVQDDVLTIRGEKKIENEVKKGSTLRSERFYGQFNRSFRLPAQVETGKVQANFKDGVLELTLPKKEEAKTKRIDIDIK